MNAPQKTTIWQWLMIPLLFLFPLVVAFFIGQLTVIFDSNVCYSESMENLRDLSMKVVNSNNNAMKEKYSELVKTLPLSGYETSCDSLKAATLKLTEQVNEASISH